MSDASTEKITLYVSSWCSHSRSVERFLDENNVPVQKIQIDGDEEARAKLIELNDGFASTPTLVFSDGSVLKEPTLDQLRRTLDLKKTSGMTARVRGILRPKDAD